MVVIVRPPYVYVYVCVVCRVGILSPPPPPFFFYIYFFSFFLSINCWMGDGETLKKGGSKKERKKERGRKKENTMLSVTWP
ncbi:hypothetical protein DFP73DRAFT_547052 [Morchella snyderi]|nr:hypothetical protein DFP73DRAFT_547052 [Morchella snyderi]